jgi:tRNA (adenine37-N6)-methyltransferase
VVEPGVLGTIEIDPPFEFALADLEGWDYIWVLYWFHLNEGWRSKVLPPRSRKRRGVFSTRAPHRPNPIGLSAVRLVAVRGRTLEVRGVDMLDGSPVLDIKPYVPYADAFPTAATGWLDAPGADLDAVKPVDPDPGFIVSWTPFAERQLAWLGERHEPDLRTAVTRILALGPTPHPYRRIQRNGPGFRLAYKAFRFEFRVEARAVTVDRVRTGYREKDLRAPTDPERALHRAFSQTFEEG